MRIIRFITQSGDHCYGIVSSDTPDSADIINEPFFERVVTTGRREHIKTFLAPIAPVNIFCLGLNYGGHASETGLAKPEHPVIFIKSTNAATGHLSPIWLPRAGAGQVDYEAELAVVIGRKCKNVTIGEADQYIFGYACANDVSARDWQIAKQMKQWARGKSFDSFCPMGPYLVTKDEIHDPHNLKIQSILNGCIMQDANTSSMIFDIYSIISDLSASMTLFPGTVILTGTPEGVGFTREPPVFLKEGDVISVRIEGIGELTNPVRSE